MRSGICEEIASIKPARLGNGVLDGFRVWFMQPTRHSAYFIDEIEIVVSIRLPVNDLAAYGKCQRADL